MERQIFIVFNQIPRKGGEEKNKQDNENDRFDLWHRLIQYTTNNLYKFLKKFENT